jgi:hypothetical protein
MERLYENLIQIPKYKHTLLNNVIKNAKYGSFVLSLDKVT